MSDEKSFRPLLSAACQRASFAYRFGLAGMPINRAFREMSPLT